MQRRKIDASREKRILHGFITNREFLSQASRFWDPSLVPETHMRKIAEWCLGYYNEYGDAPGQHIMDTFDRWSETRQGAEVDDVHEVLSGLKGRWERGSEINVPYLLDNLRDFLTKKRLTKLQHDMEQSLLRGDLRGAEEIMVAYRKIEIGQGSGSNPLDPEAWSETFASPSEPLFNFHDTSPLGKFFNRAMTRDALIGVQAPEKTGKTWWGVEFLIRALMQRRKVAMFQVGDESEEQIMKRLGVRITGRPLWHGKSVFVPTRIERDPGLELGYEVTRRRVRLKAPITLPAVRDGLKRFAKACALDPKQQYLRLSVHANDTCNVKMIDSTLDRWEQEHGFVADIIVVDYADILAPEDRRQIGRDQINNTWRSLRRLSQERHSLVIVPTQSNAMAYDMQPDQVQTMKNFSEDKRKLAHVTGMIGLNQTPAEKEMGGMRLNWIALRGTDFNPYRPLYVGTCFTLGRAMCCATM